MPIHSNSAETPTRRSVVFLESFYGGSHKEFSDCFVRHSRHNVDVLTLPDKNWGWRMRWAARFFAEQLLRRGRYQVILVTDLINLADLRANLSRHGYHVPVLLYMHENQLSYPRSDGTSPPLEHVLTDIKNVLTADRTLFNSAFHRDSFLSAADLVLRGLPDFDTGSERTLLHQDSTVMYPGIEHAFETELSASTAPEQLSKSPVTGPVIVWNHRWEPDKQPEVFRRVIEKLDEQGMEFGLILLGYHPPEAQSAELGKHNRQFESLCSKFSRRIIHSGYAHDRDEYFHLLTQGDIVISTAIQENFGLSMLQAVDAGCWPLAPNRLAYPEVLPDEVHAHCLYNDTNDLIRKISLLWEARRTTQPGSPWERLRHTLRKRAAEFHWERRIHEYDRLIDTTALKA